MQALALHDFAKRFLDSCAALLLSIRAMFHPAKPEPVDVPLPDSLGDAISTLSGWYWSEVKSTADGIVEELRSRRYLTSDYEDEYAWEVCDGHEFVIYTFKARCVLLVSDNPEEYDDVMGSDGTPGAIEPRAFFAFHADVRRFMEYAWNETEGVIDHDES